jgi:hypothetical protein
MRHTRHYELHGFCCKYATGWYEMCSKTNLKNNCTWKLKFAMEFYVITAFHLSRHFCPPFRYLLIRRVKHVKNFALFIIQWTIPRVTRVIGTQSTSKLISLENKLKLFNSFPLVELVGIQRKFCSNNPL